MKIESFRISTFGIPPHRLWLFPFVAGTAWLVTLLSLLLTWIAKGCPRYPEQQNPYVAFISDIAAFDMKPVFLVGASVTALAYIGTVIVVHWARYDHRMYGINDARWKRALSLVTVVCGTVAGVSLILLAVFDTFRWSDRHAVILHLVFAGLFATYVTTIIVYFDQLWAPSPFKRLRLYCMASAVVVVAELVFGFAFIANIWTCNWKTAGFLEWTLTFLGVVYFYILVGFVAVPEEGIDRRERQALLEQVA